MMRRPQSKRLDGEILGLEADIAKFYIVNWNFHLTEVPSAREIQNAVLMQAKHTQLPNLVIVCLGLLVARLVVRQHEDG